MASVNIGVISDTHGLLRPEAVAALEGSDLILHAGDVGHPDVLDRLREVAPVTAVRGNVDKGQWASRLAQTEILEAGGRYLYVLHDVDALDLVPDGEFDVVVHGHTHRPENVLRRNVLYFNPGSAGPRRFELPISLGRLRVEADRVVGEIVDLGPLRAD